MQEISKKQINKQFGNNNIQGYLGKVLTYGQETNVEQRKVNILIQ